MKRLFIILSVGLMAVSCWNHSDRRKVDIDKALKKRVDARELYSEASAIPLRFPGPTTLGQEISLLDVAADYLSTHAFFPASECQNSRFFRCDGIVYSFGSRSGQIAKYTDDYFICIPYQWDFGKRAPVFTNAQKTTGKVFLAFTLDRKDYVLVYNLDNRKYKVVASDTFPLGVIYAGRNYCFSPSDRAIICYTL